MKKNEEHVICVGKKEERRRPVMEAIKFGFGFYIGFNLGRMVKRIIVATNISK